MSGSEHKPHGDPCERCGKPAARHRSRKRNRTVYQRGWEAKHPGRRGASKPERQIIGIDGEGYTTREGEHLYTYMAACDEGGKVSDLRNPAGLTAREVFDWLMTLPTTALLVGYSLGYDRTKWLQSLPDKQIYRIEHPDERQGEHGPLPVQCGRYRINLVATRFSLSRYVDGERVERRTVWDLFRFFQSSFVKALRLWNIGTQKQVDAIEAMKAKRGTFAGITQEEEIYCQSECILLARLARALLDAHEDEGIVLKSYFGPGSTAAAVLARAGAKEQKAPVPEAMREGVMSAYFGGRFECSHVGPIKGELFGYDIASAYPYALAQLPCFAHGRFVHIPSKRIDSMPLDGPYPVLVSYRIDAHPKACLAWGPLPHRLPNGNIVYPVQSAGGWAWNVELAPAMRLHPGIVPLEAWAWVPGCDHDCPFREEISNLFCRRLELGKSSRGITVKLALNSMYGKSAQQVGSGVYRCMVRAGLITAHTRAQLLNAILAASDPWNVLELATDSVLSREPLDLPAPVPLGTAEAAARAGKCELGAWEGKAWSRGAFLLRPGMRFPLGRDAERDHVAARGLGVRTLYDNRVRVIRAWNKAPMAPLTVQQPTMFHGAKSSIRASADGMTYTRDDLYGRWQKPTPRTLSYAPGPKRSGIVRSPVDAKAIALVPWKLPQTPDARSVPYAGATPEDEARIIADEQPEQGYLEVI